MQISSNSGSCWFALTDRNATDVWERPNTHKTYHSVSLCQRLCKQKTSVQLVIGQKNHLCVQQNDRVTYSAGANHPHEVLHLKYTDKSTSDRASFSRMRFTSHKRRCRLLLFKIVCQSHGRRDTCCKLFSDTSAIKSAFKRRDYSDYFSYPSLACPKN